MLIAANSQGTIKVSYFTHLAFKHLNLLIVKSKVRDTEQPGETIRGGHLGCGGLQFKWCICLWHTVEWAGSAPAVRPVAVRCGRVAGDHPALAAAAAPCGPGSTEGLAQVPPQAEWLPWQQRLSVNSPALTQGCALAAAEAAGLKAELLVCSWLEQHWNEQGCSLPLTLVLRRVVTDGSCQHRVLWRHWPSLCTVLGFQLFN